jgi:hypothetical protein
MRTFRQPGLSLVSDDAVLRRSSLIAELFGTRPLRFSFDHRQGEEVNRIMIRAPLSTFD